MKAFVIHLNGAKICTAGVGEGIMTATVVRCGTPPPGSGFPEFLLQIGALDTVSDENVEWNGADLNLGDEITIKIVDAHQVDPERSRSKSNP